MPKYTSKSSFRRAIKENIIPMKNRKKDNLNLSSFLQTGKNLYTSKMLNISAEEFKIFSEFSEEDQRVILDVLQEETSLGKEKYQGEDITHFVFYLGAFTEDKLPVTYLDISAGEGYYETYKSELKEELIHILYFMMNILEGKVKKPILIAENYDRNIMGIGGGNHRVQAIRELINLDKLPSNFKIPTIIIRPREKGAYGKYWRIFQTLEQKGLINEKGNGNKKYILFKNPSFFEYRPFSQKLIWISPEKFLGLTPPISYDEDTLKDLKIKMKKGIPLDPLFLDVNENGKIDNHEGRHRAKVAEMLGIKKIPVLLYCRNDEGDFLPIERCKWKQLKPQKYIIKRYQDG